MFFVQRESTRCATCSRISKDSEKWGWLLSVCLQRIAAVREYIFSRNCFLNSSDLAKSYFHSVWVLFFLLLVRGNLGFLMAYISQKYKRPHISQKQEEKGDHRSSTAHITRVRNTSFGVYHTKPAQSSDSEKMYWIQLEPARTSMAFRTGLTTVVTIIFIYAARIHPKLKWKSNRTRCTSLNICWLHSATYCLVYSKCVARDTPCSVSCATRRFRAARYPAQHCNGSKSRPWRKRLSCSKYLIVRIMVPTENLKRTALGIHERRPTSRKLTPFCQVLLR